MTRDPLLPGPPGQPDRPDRPASAGEPRLRLVEPRFLGVLATVGLVLGWAVRPVTLWLGWTTPTVDWLQVAGLAVAAAFVARLARLTRRALRTTAATAGTVGGRGLRAHEALNRMVLGKACAYAGALAAGGYVGSALSWVGAVSDRAGWIIVTGLLAGAAAAALSVAGVFLERACRISDDGTAT